jgi:hypothetical protein
MILYIVFAIEVCRNEEGVKRGIILWHDVKLAMFTFIIL